MVNFVDLLNIPIWEGGVNNTFTYNYVNTFNTPYYTLPPPEPRHNRNIYEGDYFVSRSTIAVTRRRNTNWRNILLGKELDFLDRLSELDEYRGHLFSWETPFGLEKYRRLSIAGEYIATARVFTNFRRDRVSPVSIHFPIYSGSELSSILSEREFNNRMRLIWRRIGVRAIRYKDKTKIRNPNTRETTIISPNETLHFSTGYENAYNFQRIPETSSNNISPFAC